MTTAKPRNVRNNNPLNIRISGDNWNGSIGDDGEFVKFKSPEWGFRAAYRTLMTYRNKHGLDTVAGIITRWAPESDNNHTAAYIDYIREKLEIKPSILNWYSDTVPLDKYNELMYHMANFEGAKGAFNMQQIEQGIALA